jgi:hypothetical protein
VAAEDCVRDGLQLVRMTQLPHPVNGDKTELVCKGLFHTFHRTVATNDHPVPPEGQFELDAPLALCLGHRTTHSILEEPPDWLGF